MKHKRLFFLILLTIWSINSNTQGLLPIVQDKPALQRGARTFMNYCSGCHSLKYLRYNRMAEGLGLIGYDGRTDEDLLTNNLIFTTAKVNDPIRIALPPEDAKQWFGVVPPDLSLVAKEKGQSWLYQYLQSFYNDNSRPFGTNNLLVPGVAMPDILAPLAGEKVLIRNNENGSLHLMLASHGELNGAQLDLLIQDLVGFLVYVSEPELAVRYQIGIFVVGFFLIFLLVAIYLKKLYWQKIPNK